MHFVLSGIILVLAIIFTCWEIRQPTTDATAIGTFLILSLTLISLIIYAYDTHIIASVTKKKWEQEGILSAGYSMDGINDKGGHGRILFRLTNRSNLVIKARVWCVFKVYGVPVECGDDFNGKSVWYIFPGQTSQGWYEIDALLVKQGKTIEEICSEYNGTNRSSQLTLELRIEFRDELGNKRVLPHRKHYFVFSDWSWIPVLTAKEDW